MMSEVRSFSLRKVFDEYTQFIGMAGTGSCNTRISVPVVATPHYIMVFMTPFVFWFGVFFLLFRC